MKRYFLLFPLFITTMITSARRILPLQYEAACPVQSSAPYQYLSSSQSDGIVGSWTLILQAFDYNDNGKLDDTERKKGNTGKHFYKFNTDGTCLIHTMKLKGQYELKNVDGRMRLYTYISDAGQKTPENAWYVISVSKTELILLSQDKYAFWIFKRV